MREVTLVHDMVLPITAEEMFSVMQDPENWVVVNFPIINHVEILSTHTEREHKFIRFHLKERLLGKYYTSLIEMFVFDGMIQYRHVSPKFPFVETMSSTWIFENSSQRNLSHFRIIRKFSLKYKILNHLLMPIATYIINKHVASYYKQLIDLTKSISIKTTNLGRV